MGVSSGARANPLTGAGRHRLAQVALAHPVRTVILVHLVSRIVAWLVLEVAARGFQNPAGVDTLDPTAVDLLPLWDSKWYEHIARHGYPVPLPLDPQTGRFTYSAWAFYPLFPLLMRGLDAIGVPFIAGALVLNVVLSTLAAVLIWATLHQGTHADPQPQRARLALVAACLWSFYPATPVMLKPYTEALAMVLIAASLWALLRRRYLLVALLSVPLGFTRGVAPALGLAALVHLVVRWREDRRAGLDPLRGARVAAVVMLVMTGLSGVAWPLVAGWVSGIPSAFFEVQAAWGMQPSAGPFRLWLQWAWDSKGFSGSSSSWDSSRPTSASSPAGTVGGFPSRSGRGRSRIRSISSPWCGRSPACGASCSSTSRSPRSRRVSRCGRATARRWCLIGGDEWASSSCSSSSACCGGPRACSPTRRGVLALREPTISPTATGTG